MSQVLPERRSRAEERSPTGELDRMRRILDQTFEYRVILPEEIEADGIEANLSNGVLTVRVPKSERSQRRRIEVTSS